MNEKYHKYIMFSFRIILFVILCLFPCSDIMISRLNCSLSMDSNEDSIILAQEGDIIEFNVYIPNVTFFFTYGINIDTELAENSQADLEVIWGGHAESIVITGCNSGFYDIKSLISKAKGNEVHIRIEFKYKAKESDVISLNTSSTYVHGISTLSHNGNKISSYPELSYRGMDFSNNLFVYSTLWTTFALACIAIIAYLLSFHPNKVDYERGVTIFTALLIVAILSVLYPSLTWFGIDWCEGITFYQNLQNMSFVRYLAQLEGGMYLSEFNNAFMWIANKLLHGGKHTFVVIQILMTFLHAYIGSYFCRKSFNKYFSLDFRCVLSIIVSVFIYTVQEYTLIATSYFCVLYIILQFIDDSEKSVIRNVFSLVLILLLCTSKMVYVLFLPVAGFFYLINRKELSKLKKYLLIIIMIAVSLEATLSVIVKGGVSQGGSMGTIQSMSLFKLIEGVLYFSIQMFISALLQEVSMPNGFALNGLMFLVILISIFWCLLQLIHKTRDYKVASFIVSMHLLNFGNCALQLLTNDADMIPQNIHWMKVCYIPVNDKWWWYAFSYVSVYAILLAHIFAMRKLANNTVINEQLKDRSIQCVKLFSIFAIGILVVNQYAYRGDDNHTYKLVNQFTTPNKMIGNFIEYYSLQGNEHFLIMASSMPGHMDWYYIKNADYKVIDLTGTISEIDVSGIVANDKEIAEIYIHKEQKSNQIVNEAYYVELYSENGTLIDTVRQLDTDVDREYICFDLEEYDSEIHSLKFIFADGSLAYIDDKVRMGVY